MSIATDNTALAELQFALAKLGQGSMPSTAGAMNAGAKLIQDTWKGFALGGALPGITEKLKNPNGGYARSIRIDKLGPFQYEIYSEAKVAKLIEDGTPEHDMKTTHPFGARSRMSKKGVPYLIIPFRWGTPEGSDGKRVGFKNIMPKSVYQIVKNKKQFRQTKVKKTTHNEPNARGQQVERHEYTGVGSKGNEKGNWGDRLKLGMGDEVTQNMEGMSRMVGQDGKSAGYFTFRVISAKSPANSWVKPAVAARPVTSAVADNTHQAIGAMVEASILEDLGL
jgi:hypothetical protein